MNDFHARGVLKARPHTLSPDSALSPGIRQIDIGSRRTGSVIYVPAAYRADRPASFLLLLHGAGGNGEGMLHPFMKQADASGTLVVAPSSGAPSWDVVVGGYGPDVRIIDEALRQVFAAAAIDPGHLAVGGFSDGASYALSLGLTNGGLFSHVLAFSPGFQVPTRHEDTPRLFIAHGTADRVLPIDACSRRMVPRLQRLGYNLSYHEFQGGHEIPPAMLERAFRWFMA